MTFDDYLDGLDEFAIQVVNKLGCCRSDALGISAFWMLFGEKADEQNWRCICKILKKQKPLLASAMEDCEMRRCDEDWLILKAKKGSFAYETISDAIHAVTITNAAKFLFGVEPQMKIERYE